MSSPLPPRKPPPWPGELLRFARMPARPDADREVADLKRKLGRDLKSLDKEVDGAKDEYERKHLSAIRDNVKRALSLLARAERVV